MKKVYPVEITTHTDEILYYPSELDGLKDIDLIYFGQHSSLAKVMKGLDTEGKDCYHK